MTVTGALAVFGGTFDPVHNGHIISALAVGDLLPGSEVVMIPCQLPPHRGRPGASSDDRLAMLMLATREMRHVTVDPRELQREGPSYTYDTLVSLRHEAGDRRPLLLVLGSDSYGTLDAWYRWRDFAGLSHLLVLSRPGDGSVVAGEVAAWQGPLETRDVARLLSRPSGHMCRVKLTQVDVSATSVRQALARGESVRDKVPGPVADYIRTRGLYSPGAAG